jgi:hypothetical protein
VVQHLKVQIKIKQQYRIIGCICIYCCSAKLFGYFHQDQTTKEPYITNKAIGGMSVLEPQGQS